MCCRYFWLRLEPPTFCNCNCECFYDDFSFDFGVRNRGFSKTCSKNHPKKFVSVLPKKNGGSCTGQMSNRHLVTISRKLNNICGQHRVRSEPEESAESTKKSLFWLTLDTMLSTNIIQFSCNSYQVSVRHLNSA